MRTMWRKIFGTAALAFMLCLTGLIMSGAAFADDRCVDNGDGTVTDSGTGLMWQKETAGPMDWEAAMSYASGLSLGGHSGWRLSSRDELLGLFNSPCKSMVKVKLETYYWSSTTYYQTNQAWYVSFNNGYVHYDYQTYSQYVRAVRAGQ